MTELPALPTPGKIDHMAILNVLTDGQRYLRSLNDRLIAANAPPNLRMAILEAERTLYYASNEIGEALHHEQNGSRCAGGIMARERMLGMAQAFMHGPHPDIYEDLVAVASKMNSLMEDIKLSTPSALAKEGENA